MSIPYDQDNMDFSLRARKHAVKKVYPQVFGSGTEADTTDTKLDHESGIDLYWIPENDMSYLWDKDVKTQIGIQERFRREKYSEYREVTATAVNVGEKTEGDYFKMEADVYAYGYFNGDLFSEILLVDVDKLKNGDIEPGTQYFRRKDQLFYTWGFDEIIQRGYHIAHYTNV